MRSVDSNFNFLCGRPHGAGSPSLVHMRQPEPDPLLVDVINGWPHTAVLHAFSASMSRDRFCLPRFHLVFWRMSWSVAL